MDPELLLFHAPRLVKAVIFISKLLMYITPVVMLVSAPIIFMMHPTSKRYWTVLLCTGACMVCVTCLAAFFVMITSMSVSTILAQSLISLVIVGGFLSYNGIITLVIASLNGILYVTLPKHK